MLKASRAVTVKLKETPAVTVAGALMAKCVAVPGLTVIAEDDPVIVAVTVSVAVIVWLAAVFSVEAKVPVPWLRVALAGSTACPSVLVKCTVPL